MKENAKADDQLVQLHPQQIVSACGQFAKLLRTEGAIQVPTTWTFDGTLVSLSMVLNGVAGGDLVVLSTEEFIRLKEAAGEPVNQGQPKTPPKKKTPRKKAAKKKASKKKAPSKK